MTRGWMGWIAAALGLTLASCGGQTGSDSGSTHTTSASGGDTGSGGNSSGGALTGGTGGSEPGGAESGGAQSGGTPSGGAQSGGAQSGGSEPGGSESGGTPSGGTPSGGTPSGGAEPGGSEPGGSESGGTEPGGAEPGGTASGGAEPGGTASGGAESGGSPAGGAESGGTPAGGAESGGATTGGTTGIGGGGGMMGCFVGVQLDDCCSAPVPGDDMNTASPCFVPYREWYSAEAYAACPAAEECLMVNCTHPAPTSRVVSRGATGQCEFVDECDPTDSDCTVAVDYNVCCSCPRVTPSMVVAVDPCVVEAGQPPPTGCADCSTVDCTFCLGETPTPACAYAAGSALGICSALDAPSSM